MTNRKQPERRGKVQLINGAEFYQKMRKSLGSKRKELGPDDIAAHQGAVHRLCRERVLPHLGQR